MVELGEKSPCADVLPVQIGSLSIEEVAFEPLTSLSAFGDASAFAKALEAAHGVSWPKPGDTSSNGNVRCIWFGRGEALLTGVQPAAELAQHGAVVDQSDAWAVVDLDGAGAVDVLARVTPLDLREGVFAVGQTARSQIVHMSASITKFEENRFRLMVFRSMAHTLVHDLKQAMAAVASRR